MIFIENGSLSYGSQTVFDKIGLSFLQNQRIGVLGRNGMGKSTLLRVIVGDVKLDEGSVSREKHKKIGYMPQEMVLLSTKSVREEALSVFEAYRIFETEMAQLESQLESGDLDILERYSELHEKCTAYDAALAQERTEKILKGLGFTKEMFDQEVSQLSVGWKMRLVLAKLLLEDADFYLFDEPTNHLDLPTKEWFFDFLKQGRFGFLLVSHDRYYLDKACDYILSLERGKAKFFRGNFTSFVAEQERQREVLESAYARQQKEIARKEDIIDRFKAKANKARMAQSMMKQLDKLERIELDPLLPTISLSFPQGTRPGTVVLSLSGVKHGFEGKTLFRSVSAQMQRGERIALVAPNGTGKTTLFNLITGTYPLQDGSISFGHNVQYAVFEQDQMRALAPHNTVLEEVLDRIKDVPEATIRTFLGSFLFSGDSVYKKVSVLSGGERNRVAMVKVLLQKANVLLLDEPTNHLDLYAKEVLLQALKLYEGTILFVSHDHSFLEALATRIWELTPTGLHDYPGTYEGFLAHKKQQDAPVISSAAPAPQKAKQSMTQKKELASLESKIEKLERSLEKLRNSFCTLEYGSASYAQAAAQLKETEKQLEELVAQWEAKLSD